MTKEPPLIKKLIGPDVVAIVAALITFAFALVSVLSSRRKNGAVAMQGH